MSKITTVYNRLIELLGVTYSEKTRIPNPYSLSDNDSNFMKDGFGLKIGESNPIVLDFCTFTNERTISVVFSKELIRLESDYSPFDDVGLSLAEEVKEIQNLFYNYTELGIEASIAKVDLGTVSAPTEIVTGNYKFLTMEVNFIFTIVENI